MLDQELSNRILFFGEIAGLLCMTLGVCTLSCSLFKIHVVEKYLSYIHVNFLLALTILGLIKMVMGQFNVLWIFTLELFVLIIISMARGDSFD